MNRAELAWRSEGGAAGPNCAFVILDKPHDDLSSELRVLGKSAILPTGKPLPGSNPKSSVTRDEQPINSV